MRILHTGDWHMGHRLGSVGRADDILKNVRRIAEYADEGAADVLIVAGDLFCDRLTRDGLKEAIGQIEEIFVPFLKRGGTILAVSGNHDNDAFCESLRSAMNLAPDRFGDDAISAPGRLYLRTRPSVVRLQDAKTGAVHPFVLLPYPKASWLRSAEFEKIGDENTLKAERISQYMAQKILPHIEGDSGAAVLVSHILVRGTTTRAGYRLNENDDVVFEQNDVPTHWAYGAFGHIHKPQEVTPNAPWMRYCGSVERLDAGERDDDKSVTLVEINRTGRVGEPEVLPLASSPFLLLDIHDHAADLDRLERDWQGRPQSERESVLVRANIHYRFGLDDVTLADARLRKLFPRLYQSVPCATKPDGSPMDAAALSRRDVSDTRQVAREYIERELKTDDARREPLLQMLNELFENDALSDKEIK